MSIELTPALLSEIERRFPDAGDLLVVGDVPAPESAGSLTGPFSADEILKHEFTERVGLGVMLEPKPSDVPAIARLRDIGCRRVLLLTGPELCCENELRGLGFLPVDALGPHAAFVHDGDLLNQPREWNNSKHWANPENFDKYRW